MLTPTTTSPSLPNTLCNSFNEGISCTQGGHQVAQKFRTRTLPWKLVGVMREP